MRSYVRETVQKKCCGRDINLRHGLCKKIVDFPLASLTWKVD